MSVSAFLKPEYHDRSCSQLVWDYFACVRNRRLGQVYVQGLYTAGTQYPFDYFKLSLICLVGFSFREFSKRFLGYVILCRAKTSGHYDYIVESQFILQNTDNGVMVVSYGQHP